MADSQSRSMNYSALPVFSGSEVRRSTPPGELMAPRLSGIPLLVASPRASRRHFSAQTGVQSTDKLPRRMPQSQSMRELSSQKGQGSQIPPLPTLRLRPKPSGTAPHTAATNSNLPASHLSKPVAQNVPRSFSLNRIPRSTTRPHLSQSGGVQGPASQSATQGTRTIASKQREDSVKEPKDLLRNHRVSARASASSSSNPTSAAPSCATVNTAASAAKRTTRSVSMKAINTAANAPPKPQPPPVTRRMPTSASTRSLALNRHQQATQGITSHNTGAQNHTSSHSSSSSSSASASTTLAGVTTTNTSTKVSNSQQEYRSLRAQPKLKPQRGTPGENQEAKRPTSLATIHQGTATASTTGLNSTRTCSPAASVAQLSMTPRSYQHSNGSDGALPLPRRRKTTPASLTSCIPLSSSVPFNLSSKNAPNTGSSHIPRSIYPPAVDPSSARSSKSSHRSFSEATQRFFGKIRSASSSRSSIRASPGTNTLSLVPPYQEEWETITIEKEPSDEVRAQLENLSSGPSLAGISQKYNQSSVSSSIPGPNLAKTCSSLTQSERIEVLDYKKVFFSGKPGIVKNKLKHTDEQGNYRHVLNDHIDFRYEIVSELGKGSFGKVFQCLDHKTGRLVAVKVTCNRSEMRRQARVEAQILQNLAKAGNSEKHHFLRYLGSFSFRDHFCITSEILGDNLYDLLRRTKYKGLEIDFVRYITRQLVEGLEFLDLQGVIHCDLKPENILISDKENCQVKIIDFGSGCYENNRVYTYIQSRFYRAPEILLGVPYSTAIDMWSLGCIVPELILGKPLFPGEDETDQIACLCQTLGSPDQFMLKSCSRANLFFDARGNPLNRRSPDGIVRGAPGSKRLETMLPPLAADFCLKILQWSPHKRLSAGGALFHEFVLGV